MPTIELRRFIIPRLVAFCVVNRALRISAISHARRWRLQESSAPFGHLRLHLAILGARSCHVTSIFGDQAQKEDTTHRERCWCCFDAYSSNLLELFNRNGTDGALEGHNIPRTTHRRTSEYMYSREPCVLANVFNAYAHARVLSTCKPGSIPKVCVKYRLVCGVFSMIT